MHFLCARAASNPDQRRMHLERARRHLAAAVEVLNSGRVRHPFDERVSFWAGDAGVHALAAAVLSQETEMSATEASGTVRTHVDKLLALHRAAATVQADEILYGRAGYLYALLFAKRYTHNLDSTTQQRLQAVAQSVFAQIVRRRAFVAVGVCACAR